MAKKNNTKRADGRIAVQIYLGMVEGKRKYKTVYGNTQKEANKKAEQIKVQIGKGIDITAERDTFEKWADRWLNKKRNSVSISQVKSYECAIKHLNKRLEHLEINKIRTYEIQEIIDNLAKNNPNTKKPTAKKTLLDIRLTARQIFDFAINNRVLDYNPVVAVEIPAKAPKGHRRALTEKEQKWIIDTPHPRAQIAAMIMMYAGLRRGELIPLTWGDIDLEKATISINKTVELINGKPNVKDTAKTRGSIRVVDIPQVLVYYLQSKKPNTPSKSKVSDLHELVCTSADKKMLTDSGWKRLWTSYMKDLNMKYGDFSNMMKPPKSKFMPGGVEMKIPNITAHWLRHTYATMLYMAGVDVLTAKEQLGHTKIETTLNIYTHLDKKHKRKSINKLNDFLNDASHMQVGDKEETA